MTVWEKALVNMEKGYARISSFAANFSERVKSDINIIRIRMQMEDLRTSIAKEHAFIGARLLELAEDASLPTAVDQFLTREDIAATRERIQKLEKDLDGLEEELSLEAATITKKPGTEKEKAA